MHSDIHAHLMLHAQRAAQLRAEAAGFHPGPGPTARLRRAVGEFARPGLVRLRQRFAWVLIEAGLRLLGSALSGRPPPGRAPVR
ncbi:hypothetical protein DEH18_18365 [Streptomyces sp. NHF165]|uniref:hypothetical protein n=1 Tax=Streptomyces TaxID=1883 RepID=UPI0004C7207F|nr:MULTISPECIES: hypothetical protein [Streptomyces]QHF95484.1 hypothetical protein DEH18_18365 [Streptomyces sp. NHF165]